MSGASSKTLQGKTSNGSQNCKQPNKLTLQTSHFVCSCVCLYIVVFVCMSLRLFVCRCVCLYVVVFVCMQFRLFVCRFVYLYISQKDFFVAAIFIFLYFKSLPVNFSAMVS